ncbi:MAG: mechanosensitive ion channel protein MscS [Alphaproteobacteria bacterium]|nr:MAG: mechanosensitive ion channel protein MscS [Alphaproteobacteria bacterium]
MLEKWLHPEQWRHVAEAALVWLQTHVLTLDAGLQAAVLALAVLLSGWLGRHISGWCQALIGGWSPYRRVAPFIDTLTPPIAALLLIRVGVGVLRAVEVHTGVLAIATSLLVAWIVVRFASNFIRNRQIAKAFATVAWLVAALNILGLLVPLIDALRGFGISLGETRLSAYSVITAILTAVALLWLALFLSRTAEEQFARMKGLNPSLQVLFSKILRIVLLFIAVLIALASAGIDLTAFAVFSGALGVGLGFGLQKVVSNFVSGIILLLDRSIKPGDVIEIGQTYGWINNLAARYTSVVTRDGTEFLIPNEDMITLQVINWSHSDRNVRRRIPVQVTYASDLKLAMQLMEEAAGKVERVLNKPAPRTLIRGFGADGVDLELRFWIDDPYNGIANVSSDIMEQIWDLFHQHGIEFPFPQRDVHIAPDTADKLRALLAEAREPPPPTPPSGDVP